MKLIGQILLWGGFLSGSLAAVLHAPPDGVKHVKKEVTEKFAKDHGFEYQDLSSVEVPTEGWHLIPWGWYIGSALVCLAGVVVIHLGKSGPQKQSAESASSLAEIRTSFDRLINNINQLAKDVEKLPPSHVVTRIDEQLAEDFRVIADGRDNITAEYGLDVFADVMTQFAAGERSINRAWSASADGYVDEAQTCVERAAMLLDEARTLLAAAKKPA